MDVEYKAIETPSWAETDAQTGEVEAIIATFDVVDRDDDIVRASAFTHGQAVPMVWAHDWTKPVGRGVISVEPPYAKYRGQFFLNTQMGREAYETCKAMGDLQRWSWGFRPLDPIVYAEQDGRRVRILSATETLEVSPVLVGASVGTRTTAIKEAAPTPPQENLDEIVKAIQTAIVQAKEGRTLSESNRQRLRNLLEALSKACSDLEDLLRATEPPEKAYHVPALSRRLRALELALHHLL